MNQEYPKIRWSIIIVFCITTEYCRGLKAFLKLLSQNQRSSFNSSNLIKLIAHSLNLIFLNVFALFPLADPKCKVPLELWLTKNLEAFHFHLLTLIIFKIQQLSLLMEVLFSSDAKFAKLI